MGLFSQFLLNEAAERMEPTKKDYPRILAKMQDELGVKVSPKWFRFLVFQEGTSNKFHYFAVFEKGKSFVAANASGRIGGEPQVHEIATGDYEEVEKKALSKYRAKSAKGYTDITDELRK